MLNSNVVLFSLGLGFILLYIFTGNTFTSAPVSILKSIDALFTLSFIFYLSTYSACIFLLNMAFISYSLCSKVSILQDPLNFYSFFFFVLHILTKCLFFHNFCKMRDNCFCCMKLNSTYIDSPNFYFWQTFCLLPTSWKPSCYFWCLSIVFL